MKEYLIQQGRSRNALKEQAKEAHLAVSDMGIIERVCAQTEKFFGYPPEELIGNPFNKLVPAAVYDPNAPHFRDKLRKGDSIETTFQHKSGHFFIGTMMPKGKNVKDGDLVFDSTINRLEDSKSAMGILQDFQTVGRLGGWEFDVTRNTFSWTEGVYRIFDLEVGAAINPEHALYYFHNHQYRVKAAFRRCLNQGESLQIEVQIISARNNTRWVRLTGRPTLTKGRVTRIRGVIQDLSELRNVRNEKAFLDDCMSSIMSATDDMALILDKDLTILFCNAAFQMQFERAFEIIPQPGDSIAKLLSKFPNERRIYMRLWERALARDQFCVEMPLAQRKEEMPIFEMRFRRITNKRGELIGAAHIAKDITSKIQVQEKLNYMARHDPLTGLFNRREFQNLLGRGLGNAKKRGTAHSLLYMDLERFKAINEKCGSSAGDELLRQVARTISAKVRQRDAVARIGGDEFAALLENCPPEEARRVAESIRNTLLGTPFSWGEADFEIGISIGVVSVDEHSNSPEKLMKLADNICYAAKTSGSSCINIFQPEPTTISTVDESKQLDHIKMINHALEFTEYLRVFVQPIKPIISAVWGEYLEVYSRIQDESGSLIEPETFLPLAEEVDLTSNIDLVVLKRVLNWIAQHRHQDHRLKLCSINLHNASLKKTDFITRVTHEIHQSRAQPEKLCFELEESLFIDDPKLARHTVQALKGLGCKIAADHVGKRPSSLEYIATFNLDFVKIDGDLVSALHTDKINQVRVEAIHKLAHLMGAETIGHHVTSDAVLAEVRKIGLHFGQGYALAETIPLESFTLQSQT
ncbi:MAG: EAL domain-containing protein [Pseudomonadales bacterium]|nr:EAL domain-containing protein [Pseudomonadales bacterium]